MRLIIKDETYRTRNNINGVDEGALYNAVKGSYFNIYNPGGIPSAPAPISAPSSIAKSSGGGFFSKVGSTIQQLAPLALTYYMSKKGMQPMAVNEDYGGSYIPEQESKNNTKTYLILAGIALAGILTYEFVIKKKK